MIIWSGKSAVYNNGGVLEDKIILAYYLYENSELKQEYRRINSIPLIVTELFSAQEIE